MSDKQFPLEISDVQFQPFAEENRRRRGQALGVDAGSQQEVTLPNMVCVVLACVLLFTIIVCFLTHLVLGLISFVCIVAQAIGLLMGRWVLRIGEGSEQMKTIGHAIREGSEAYVKTMFGTIFKLAMPATILIFVFYFVQFNFGKAFMITLSFVLGALCSSVAGIIGMWSSTRSNARVAQTSCIDSFRSTIVVALRSGTVAGITVVSLAVFGICLLFSLCNLFVERQVTKVPLLLVGYGFGASFVAMFAQLGGGIYTKAADVGADLCGKIELGIPEDDPRNPAVVADLVGDNVGDCCARGADLFESLSAEIIAAMILGGSLTEDSAKQLDDGTPMCFILFPLVVHVADLLVSMAGVMTVRGQRPGMHEDPHENPMKLLKQGYVVAVTLAAFAFVGTTRLLLHDNSVPDAWWHFALCGAMGMFTGFVVVLITQYYTDFTFKPVQNIAQASESGHGTNIISGLAVGFESTFLPICLVVLAILVSYFLGMSTNMTTSGDEETDRTAAGLFGTAVATMGMLSNLTYVLAMDVFGPIADNAAGIVEMSPDCPRAARDIMDRLDAAGNTTKAFTKGFAVSSAGLACFLLFRAFLDVVHDYTGQPIDIDIVQPEVFCGGIIGSTTVFLFAAFAMHAVGETAQQVVTEVRRQFRDIVGIATGNAKPEYGICVAIVSRAAINKMVQPGLLVVLMPVFIGGLFRLLGAASGDELLGAKCMTAYLVCSSMTAMLVALFLNNGGGAWDNAKKYIESGKHGGKGSEAHKAAVTGDTVGDPCKDTAGPSLHVLMKLTATVTMVVGPIVAVRRKSL